MKQARKTSTKSPIHRRVRRHASLIVLPSAENQFRPHLIRWYGLLLILFAAFLAFTTTQHTQRGVMGAEADITATSLLRDTNHERIKAGEQPLRYDEKLSSAAFMKAQDMLQRQYWAHTAPDGTTPWYWFTKADYNYSYAGENLAKNFTTTETTVAAWMGSTRHRENILNEHFSDVGFAVVDGELDGKQTKLVVALYGAPASSVAGASVSTFAASSGTMHVLSQIGMSVQAMPPVVLGSVVLLIFSAFIGLVAHGYRRRAPKPRHTLGHHHGVFKAMGLTAVAIVLITLYSGGQI